MKITNWIIENWVEIIGVITGLAFIILEIYENKWLWPVSIASALFYIFIFFKAKIYADMSLQIYYVIIGIYGWFLWARNSIKNQQEKLHISKTKAKPAIVLFGAGTVLFFIIAFLLKTYTDSPVPYIDAFTTSASIIATWMLARKLIEQWLIWIIVNLSSVGLYIYRDLYLTAGLYFVFAALAVAGYIKWKNSLQNQHSV